MHTYSERLKKEKKKKKGEMPRENEVDVAVRVREKNGSPSRRGGMYLTLFWDTHDGKNQACIVIPSGMDKKAVVFRIPTDSPGYIRGVLEMRVRDDDESRSSLFAVRRGTMEPLDPISMRSVNAPIFKKIVDTKVALVCVAEFQIVRRYEGLRAKPYIYEVPVCGSNRLEAYDSRLADQTSLSSGNTPILGSSGLLVDVMRSVESVSAPYRTQNISARSRIPRWYFMTEGMQIAYRNTRFEEYEKLARAVSFMWLYDTDRKRRRRMSTRQHMLVGAQMCQTHHAWSHYVTDKAGRRRLYNTDTWNRLRGTAKPGAFGKDCDDGAIETHATFDELRRVCARHRNEGLAMHSVDLLTRTYCCVMVMCTIRPLGLKTPDGIPAGADPSDDPVHESLMSFIRENAPDGTIERDTDAPSRNLHMYCMLIHWDLVRALIGPEKSDRIPRVPPECYPTSPSLSKSDNDTGCDPVMILESTETFAADNRTDGDVLRVRKMLAEIATHPDLEGAVRVPESHEMFVKDDFYRSDIVCYSPQLLKYTDVAMWDFTKTNPDSGEKLVGPGHRQFAFTALTRGAEGVARAGFGLSPHISVNKTYHGGPSSTGGGVRYFVDTARIQKSLPEFVTTQTTAATAGVTTRPVWPVDETIQQDQQGHPRRLFRIPVWCLDKYAEKLEDIITDMCSEERGSADTKMEGCDMIKFGRLGTAFSITFSTRRKGAIA